ncbi:translin-associated factor X-interacting protein 1 isoform X1 [Leucoraja erinacea]|uniref:translin-associated factor X-interacting protein 1 isoform X1 n=1 Tax=Leucoraja erinaceus TaxID=7782 RepID=UPI002457DCC8|nr:translin-associated factor X-interacting protein 1 isoform X1 [Leucoraja erinacea]
MATGCTQKEGDPAALFSSQLCLLLQGGVRKPQALNPGAVSSKANVAAPRSACLTYQLQGSDKRYQLPLKELLPSVQVNEGYISSWPGHITSEIIQHKQAFQPSNIDKQHGYNATYVNSSPKPRFLEKLEDHLRKELEVLDPNIPNAREINLQAYREVFEYFIEDLKTYKPLLSAIKNEYEVVLAQQRNRIRELEPLQGMLVTTTENCEHRLLALREEEKFEILSLKRERTQLLKNIDNLMETQDSLETQVRKLQEELATEYERYREQRDARILLIADMNNLHVQQEEPVHSQAKEADEADDPIKLKLALKVAHEDLKGLQFTLNEIKAEYGDVIPRREFETLEKTYNELTEKYEHMQRHFTQLKMEHNTLLDVNKNTTLERDKLSAEVELLRTKVSGSDVAVNEANQDYFEGLGTGEDVVMFLRHNSLVKNVNLTKEDLINVLRDIWEEKSVTDHQNNTKSNLPEFFHKYLRKKFGDSAMLWAYNIYYGCRHHQDDEFIGLFFRIINGIVDESVYHGHVKLISDVLNSFISRDTAGKGILTKHEFSQAIKSALPNKGGNSVIELVAAATTQLGDSKKISYNSLFTEQKDSVPAMFITLLQRQYTAERTKYIDELRNVLEDKEELTVNDLKKAFETIDPSIGTQALATYLGQGFQTTGESLTEASVADTDIILDRLQANDVKRIGPKIL